MSLITFYKGYIIPTFDMTRKEYNQIEVTNYFEPNTQFDETPF